MKSRTWIIIGILIIGIIAASAYLMQNTDSVAVTVDLNGTNAKVDVSSIFGVPAGMQSEMEKKAGEQMLEPKSTVESIKNDMNVIAKNYNRTATVTIKSQFGTDQLPMPATVSGTSMVPTLQDGQQIIVLKTKDYKVDDIVVATHPSYGMIVKRLKVIEDNRVYLMSDNRKVEVFTTEKNLGNGLVEVDTYKKTPLDTWLPRANIIGVVRIY
ncbi:MAG: S24/S26 family peptidase [Methanobacterium sp.]